ncbi:MAG: hypothetical protein ACE5FI_14095 [Anaerolineales bacterium]
MAVTTTLYLSQFTFNAVTYTKTLGGPLDLIINENAQQVADRTGDAQYPTFVAVTDIDPVVFVKMRDVASLPTRGANSDLVATISDGNATKTLTLSTMTYIGVETNIVRASPGEIVLQFVHESADGSTNWMSIV